MLDIAFVNETEEKTINFEELIDVVFTETMITENNNQFYEVSVIFVSKSRIQEINKLYRNIDKVTDVISFALFDKIEDNDIIINEGNITTLGDIFICLDKAKEQSSEYGHSLLREVAFLACHGLLHLLGYDHYNLDEENIMFNKQEEILKNLNINR